MSGSGFSREKGIAGRHSIWVNQRQGNDRSGCRNLLSRPDAARRSPLLQRVFVPALLGLVALLAACCHGAFAQQATGANPPSFEQLAARAQAAMDANRTDEAIGLYEQAVALQPTWSEGWWELGTTFFDEEQFAKAHDAFLHFVQVEHRQPGPGFGMLGLTEYELKDYEKALIALDRAMQLGLGDNPAFVHRVLYEDGVLTNYFGRPEIAFLRLKLVADEIANDNPAATKEDAVLANTDLIDAFGLTALRMAKLPSEIPADKADLIREAGIADAMIAMLDDTKADEELKQLVALYPNEPGVHYFYGVHLLKTDPPAAVAEFQHEIALSPKHVPARIQLALEFLETSDYKQGLKYAQEAVALAPGNFVGHLACGRLWLGEGDTQNALKELRTAVKLSPGSPDAHFALSRALAQAGQPREAAKERAEFERLKAIVNAADRQ